MKKPATKRIKGIYLRGNTYWLAHTPRGQRRQFVSLETDNEAEALTKAEAIRNSPTISSSSIRAEIAAFLAYQESHEAWAPGTLTSGRRTLNAWADWCDGHGRTKVDEFTPGTMQTYYEMVHDRTGSATAHVHTATLRTFFKWALRRNLITTHPCVGLKMAKRTKTARCRFCTTEESYAIIAGTQDADLLFVFHAGFFAGMRKNEIVQARPEWFDLERSVIHIPGIIREGKKIIFRTKSGLPRTIPLVSTFKTFLQGYGLREPFMLRSDKTGASVYRWDFSNKGQAYPRNLQSIHKPWVTPHVLRHTFASLLAQQGLSLFKIAKWLGDGILVAEAYYAHLAPVDDSIEAIA